jgi:predicted HTH domain antitoxin
MESISVEEFLEHPDKLLSDAQSGEIAVVTQDGKPVFMSVPMGANLDNLGMRLALALSLFDREQVSIGVASRIACLSTGEMIDELGRRHIPVARYAREEFAEEMKYVRGLAGRR